MSLVRKLKSQNFLESSKLERVLKLENGKKPFKIKKVPNLKNFLKPKLTSNTKEKLRKMKRKKR
jgi:hypothetical protein